jgi:hypothetical protein
MSSDIDPIVCLLQKLLFLLQRPNIGNISLMKISNIAETRNELKTQKLSSFSLFLNTILPFCLLKKKIKTVLKYFFIFSCFFKGQGVT